MSNTAQIIRLVSSIELPSDTLVANSVMVSLMRDLDDLKKQEKAIKRAIDDKVAQVKEFMGAAQSLVTKDGIELATWKYSKEREKIDSERLKSEYPAVYNQVVELIAGSRVFLVK